MATTEDFGPAITTHAELRWTQRSHLADTSLRRAWETAETIAPYAHGDLSADEVRYHADTETVLLDSNGNITTVLRADLLQGDPRAAIDRLQEGDDD